LDMPPCHLSGPGDSSGGSKRRIHVSGISTAAETMGYILACDPSQNAPFFECLQPHQATFFGAARSTLIGENAVPWWEPSQNGWFLELPQAHQKCVPAAMSFT
jgi:hypothetical protein